MDVHQAVVVGVVAQAAVAVAVAVGALVALVMVAIASQVRRRKVARTDSNM